MMRGRTGHYYLVLLVLLAANVTGGCAGIIPEVGGAAFAPDGRTLAWVKDTTFFAAAHLLSEIPPMWFKSVHHLYWCDPAKPWAKRHIKLGSDLSRTGLAFSPDSRRLAVRADEKIFIVDLASGRHKMLDIDYSGGVVFWLDEHRIIFDRGPSYISQSDEARLTVLSVRVDEQPMRPEPVFEAEVRGEPEWSPNGRHVLFTSAESGRVTLGNVRTGKAHLIGPAVGVFESVAWSPDGSSVICLFHRSDSSRLLSADLLSGRITDLTEKLMAKHKWRRIEDWTADHKQLLVLMDDGWALVDPEAGNTVLIADILAKNPDADPKTFSGPQVLAVPGWLWMWHNDNIYAVNTHTGRFVWLSREKRPWWLLSPDRRWLAETRFLRGSPKVHNYQREVKRRLKLEQEPGA